MNKSAILLISTFITAGCSSNDSTSDVSILNGKWATACDAESPVNFIASSSSNKRVMTFKDGAITNQLYLYSDTACTVAISKDNDNLFGGLFVGYTIGSNATSSNGVAIKEIDFINNSGDILPDIYLLLNSSSELHLGIKELSLMVPCPSADDAPVQNTPSCWTVRPVEIDYNQFFTKIDG